jgi:hypothetical protein
MSFKIKDIIHGCLCNVFFLFLTLDALKQFIGFDSFEEVFVVFLFVFPYILLRSY